jgi:hypothetical protein
MAITSMATVSLHPDRASPEGVGELQLFVVKDGVLYTSWKTTDEAGAPWTPLQLFQPQPGQPVDQVAAGRLSDGRAQVFVSAGQNTMTTWKQTTNEGSTWTSSNGPNSWSPFTPS